MMKVNTQAMTLYNESTKSDSSPNKLGTDHSEKFVNDPKIKT
jgi:hypothetical protein